jgi:hypothetical protein
VAEHSQAEPSYKNITWRGHHRLASAFYSDDCHGAGRITREFAMVKFVPTMLAIATIALGAAAHAQTSQRPSQAPSAAQPAPVQPGGRTLTEAQLRAELEKLGFKNVRDIKQKGNTIEARATKDGKRVSLNIDTNTGKVIAR